MHRINVRQYKKVRDYVAKHGTEKDVI